MPLALFGDRQTDTRTWKNEMARKTKARLIQFDKKTREFVEIEAEFPLNHKEVYGLETHLKETGNQVPDLICVGVELIRTPECASEGENCARLFAVKEAQTMADKKYGADYVALGDFVWSKRRTAWYDRGEDGFWTEVGVYTVPATMYLIRGK